MTYIRPPQDQGQETPDVSKIHREILFRHLAFVNTLRLQLRQKTHWEELKPWLPDDEFNRLGEAMNKATQLNHRQAQQLRDLYESGWIASQWYVTELMGTIKEAYRCQGISERIKNTPLPHQYSFFTKLFVWVFVLLLPFGLVQHLGWQMLPLYVTLATVFTITERIGSRTENPFDNKIEDVPLNAICRTIEIDLRQQLGELSVPPPLKPQGGVLM
jgi:putative membrane protein